MTDIATLGFAVNTSGLKTGVQDLSAIASAAKTAEQHTANLEQAFDDLSRSSGQLKNVSQQFPQMAQQVAQVDTAVQRLSGSVSAMTSTMSRLREVTSTLQSLATVGRDVHTTLEQAEMTLTGLAAAAGALRNLANEFLPVSKAAQAVIETLQRLENAFASLQQATAYLRNLANQFFPLQKSMGDTMTTAQRMQAAFKQAFEMITTSAAALVETFQFLKENTWLVEVAMAGLKGGIGGVGKELGEMAGEAMAGAGELEKTTGIIDELASALAMLGVGLGFKELMNYTDIFGRISVQMSQASQSALEYGESMRALYRLSQQTGQSFEETAIMFARMTRATSELGLSQSQLLDVTGLVNKMLMTAQLPAASASAALFQFSQAMSSGVLRGEELNSIMEQMPPLAKAIADGMGYSMGQLRKFSAEGVLTSQNVIAALMKQKDVINEQFEAMAGGADTMSNMMSRVDNAMVMLVGKADELSGFSESIGKVFSAITTGMGSPEILNAMVSVMKLLPLVIMPAVDTLQVFIEYWEELAAVFITYKITILVLEAFVAWKQLTIGLTVARAAMAAIIPVLNAMGVATATLTAAVKGFLIQIGIMAGIGVAIGALASYFLLTANNVDASQQAIEAHDKTLERLGYTADEVTEKFKTMNEEQQKLTQQEVELSINLNTQAIDDTLQKIDESFRDNMVSKWFGGDEWLQQKTEVLTEFSEIIESGGRGLADFAKEQRNANLITEEGYQELLKLQRTMDEHKESLAEAEARLRIITNTRRGDEEATLGQNKALAVQRDMLSKLTEEWNKYIAKQIESARTFAMNPMELAVDKGQQSQRGQWAIEEAVALTELQERYQEYQAAVQANNATAAEAAAIQAQSAENRRIEAVGMQAMLDKQKQLYEQGASLAYIEAQAEEARQKAMDIARQQIDVQQTLIRLEREAAEAREKAYEAAARNDQKLIDNARAMAEAMGVSRRAAADMEATLKGMERAKTESMIPSSNAIQKAALDFEALVVAIQKAESNMRHFDKAGKVLTSPAGALGIMQVMPATGKLLGFSEEDLRNQEKNLEAGRTLLRKLVDAYTDLKTGEVDLQKVIAAYNAGEPAVNKYNGIPPFEETQKYVPKVLGFLNEQLLIKKEMSKLDATTLQTGANQILQEREKTKLTQLQTELLKGQYRDVAIDSGVISADQVRQYVESLKTQGLAHEQAVAAVTKAIDATANLRDAQQAQEVIQTSLTASVAAYQQGTIEATLASEKQTQTITAQVTAMQAQDQALQVLNRTGQVALSSSIAATGQVINAGIATSKEQVQEYYALIEKINTEVRQMVEQGVGSDAIAAKVNAMTASFNAEQLKKITDITTGLKDQRKQLEENAPSWAELTGQTEAYNTVSEVTAELSKIVTIGQEQEADTKKKNALATAQAVDDAKRLNAAIERAADGYKASLTPMEQYQAKMKQIAADEALLIANQDKFSAEQWEEMARGIEQARKEAAEMLATADPMAAKFKEVAETIYGEWNNMFVQLFQGNKNAFADFADNIKDMFLRMLAEMAAAALAKPILVPIMQMAGGMMGLDNNIIGSILGKAIPGAADWLMGGGTSGGGFLSNLFGGGGTSGGGLLGTLFGSNNGITTLLNSASNLLFDGGLTGMLLGTGAATSLATAGATAAATGTMSLFASGAGAVSPWLLPGSSMVGLGATGAGAAGAASMSGITAALGTVSTVLSAVVPVLGVFAALYSSGVIGPTPHPSSVFTAGGFWQSKHGPEYPGKGGGVTGASGIVYGYDWGHTDPKAAEDMRNSIVDLDKVLTDLAPTVDLAGVKLGEFGKTAEGFIANGKYVEDMDAVIEGFVKAWVNAAHEAGAVSELVNNAMQGMTGSAEDLTKVFAILQQMDAAGTLNQQLVDIVMAVENGTGKLADTLAALSAIQGYVNFDSEAMFADLEAQLQERLKTTFTRLGEAGQAVLEGLNEVNWLDADSIQELGGLVQARYALEIQMLQEIEAYLQGLSANFGASIEDIQLAMMSGAEKYEYFSQQAEAAFEAMKVAIDPAEIAQQAEAARQAIMAAWQTLDEDQKNTVGQDYIALLQEIESTAAGQLEAAQASVLSEHQATADMLRSALEAAGTAAAAAITSAATALDNAGSSVADLISTALSTPLTVNVEADVAVIAEIEGGGGYAAGGIVGGTWNGKSGTAGDTVLTALTPGEAVISRDQTQKHRGLVEAIMADQVRYAASGLFLPDPSSTGSSTGSSSNIIDIGANSGSTHHSYNKIDYSNVSILDLSKAGKDIENTTNELLDFMESLYVQIDDIAGSKADRTLENLAETMDDNIAKAKELGASEQQLAEVRILSAMQVQQVFNDLLTKIQNDFFGTIDEMRLSVMTDSEKYDYYTQIAEAAFDSLKTATDPAEIERLAAELNEATKSAWGLLDETQRKATLAGFEQFLVDAEDLVRTRLAESQQQALDSLGLNAEELTNQISAALGAGAEDLGAVISTAMSDSGNVIGQAIAAALEQPIPLAITVTIDGANATAEVPGMASGGIVGGTWNGKSGIAGDTVLTALTPGEAVIPRDQTEKHRPLIEAIMADDVRYAATGTLPPANPGGSNWGQLPGNPGNWDNSSAEAAAADAANNAEQLAELMKQISNEIRDLGLTDFERELATVADQLADTKEEISELGGTALETAQAEELAALQEAKIREEYADRMTDLLQPYQDLLANTTEFNQALRDLEQETADALEQAAQLASSEEELATARQTIQDAALLQEQALREAYARNLNDLLTPYQNVLDGTSEFQQSLRDFAVQTDEAIEQARQLGASEEQLDLIREAAAQQQQELHQEYVRQVQDFMRPFRDINAGTTEFEKALRDLQVQTEESLRQAEELGLGETYLAEIRQSAALQEQDLRDQYAQQLNDLLQPYQDAKEKTSAFDQQLRDLARQTEEALEQAQELGASQEQLAQITEGAAAMEAKLREERQQSVDDLLQPYRTATLGVSAFTEQLAELTRQTEDALTQAQELGATEEELAEIRIGAADMEAKLREDRNRSMQDLLQPYQDAIDQTSTFDQQLNDLARQTEEAIRQAEDLNATTAELAIITEGAAAMEAKLREERQQQLDDLLTQYNAEPMTAFEQQLYNLAQQAEEAKKQAADLGASTEQLAQIDAWAAQQTAELEEQRRQSLDDLLQSYQDALDPVAGLDQQLRDLTRQMEDTLEQAQELGATEEELTLIREGAAAMAETLREDWQRQIDDFMDGFPVGVMNDFEQSLANLAQQVEDAKDQAEELGLTTEQLGQIDAWAAQQAAELEKQRRDSLDDLLQGYRDASSGATAFEQQLRDLVRQTEDAIEQAQNLGATEAELAEIRAGAAAMEAQLREEQAQQLADFMAPYEAAAAGLNDMEQAILDLQRQTEAAMAQAVELGATEEDLATIRAAAMADLEQQRDDLLQSFELDMMTSYDQQVAEIKRRADEARQQLAAIDAGLAAAPGWGQDITPLPATDFSSVIEQIDQSATEQMVHDTTELAQQTAELQGTAHEIADQQIDAFTENSTALETTTTQTTEQQTAQLIKQLTDLEQGLTQVVDDLAQQIGLMETNLVTATTQAYQAIVQAVVEQTSVLMTAVAEQTAGLTTAFTMAAGQIAAAIPQAVPANTDDIPGMAAGGIVNGIWNGKAGTAGDTVLTALTPGEAVIPRAQSQKHRGLIDAIMADQVQYAANGVSASDISTLENQYGVTVTEDLIAFAEWLANDLLNSGAGSDNWQPSVSATLGDLMNNLYGAGQGSQQAQNYEYMLTLDPGDWSYFSGIASADTDITDIDPEYARKMGELNQMLYDARVATEQTGVVHTLDQGWLMTETSSLGYNNLNELINSGADMQRVGSEISLLLDEIESNSGWEDITNPALQLNSEDAYRYMILQQMDALFGQKAWENANSDILWGPESWMDDPNTDSSAGGSNGSGSNNNDSLIDQWEQDQLEALEEERRRTLNELLYPYQDAIDQTSAFDQQLRDLARQTEEAIRQAEDLNATEAELAIITEGAAAMEAKLREERDRSMADLLQPYQDAIDQTSAFDQQLRDLARQTEEAMRQAEDLNATEAELAIITEGAAAMEAKLREERDRSMADLLQPYQDAIDQTSAFDQQLRDLARQTEEAIRQAEDLNATTAELAVITEGAAAMEAKLREERDQSMADMLQPYQDAMEQTTTFAAQLRDLARQTEEAIKQAEDLNATEEELATIREGAAAMETKLLEEQARQTQQLLQPYQDAIDGLTGVAAAYRDWQQQTDEAIRQAEELGLTEEELTIIREGADAQLAEMARNWREQLDELLIPARESDLSDFAKSLRDLNRQISGMIDQAIDLGASEAELAEIRAYGAEQAQAMADNQIEQITDQFQAQIDQVQAELEQFTQSIDAFGQSLESNRVQIRRASEDWDEVAYQTQRLAELEARRATEEIDEQLATLGEMQDAIMARYQAEQQALDEVVASIERMHNLAKQLRDFLDSLKLGNLTTLSPEARLNEAAQQYQTTLTAAQGGDEEAIADLANKAQSYLTEAQSYYASSTAYARIFDDVVASVEAVASGIEAGPTVDEIIAENTGKMAQLQETTIEEINALEAASRELQALSDAEAQQHMDELTTEMNAQTQAIVAELTAQQLADANWINLTAAEFTLLRDVLLTISQDEIEAMSAGFSGMAEANRTLQAWIEAGQISSSEDLDRVIAQLQSGSGANQTMIALLQTRVSQGGADAEQAQAMLDRLMIAQGAYDQINSILAGIKAGDVQFNAETIAKLQEQMAILQSNGVSANQNANNLLAGINTGASNTTNAVNQTGIKTDNNTDAILLTSAQTQYHIQMTAAYTLMLVDPVRAIDLKLFDIQWRTRESRDLIAQILAVANYSLTALRDILNKLNTGINTYAGGGMMEPGLALVGEEGPELVRFTQPGYVYTAKETEQILGRGQRATTLMVANDDADDTDNAEVVGELRALVRVQSAANQQLIAKLDAVESRLAGIEAKARLEAAA